MCSRVRRPLLPEPPTAIPDKVGASFYSEHSRLLCSDCLFGAGVVSTVAGLTVKWADGVGTVVAFNNPQGVSVASDGTIFVADSSNCRIRMIATSGE